MGLGVGRAVKDDISWIDIRAILELLDARTIGHVLVSPRKRAQQTFDLLFPKSLPDSQRPQNVQVEEGVREWTYGAFEGRLATDINKEREARGEKEWDIVRHLLINLPCEVLNRPIRSGRKAALRASRPRRCLRVPMLSCKKSANFTKPA